MSWVAVAGTAITVVGGYLSNKQANKGNKAAQQGQQGGIDEQRREYDQTRQDQLPWLQAGQDALGRQQSFLDGDWSGFENAPDYKFAVDQGLKLSDRSAAARGALFAGGHEADLVQLGQGLATQNADNYWNKLAGRAGQGMTTAQNLGDLGANMATNIGNAYANIGQARQSSYNNNAQFTAGLFGQMGNLAQNYLARRNGGTYNYGTPITTG
jgi:hypothetical protein